MIKHKLHNIEFNVKSRRENFRLWRLQKEWKRWRHVVKLDPDKIISKDSIEKIAKSGTQAIMVSGTQDVTRAKVEILLKSIKKYDIPKILEPSDPRCITGDFDFIFVPCVLNSNHISWLVGKHVSWIENFKINWDIIVPEAYIVLNPDSSVAKVTGAKTNLSIEEIVSYAVCAEKFFNFPVVYIEYSGTYGDVEIVKAVGKVLTKARLFYGGGINSRKRALEMARYADTIVVGNAFYEKLDNAIETVIKSG